MGDQRDKRPRDHLIRAFGTAMSRCAALRGFIAENIATTGVGALIHEIEPGALSTALQAAGFDDIREEARRITCSWRERPERLRKLWYDLSHLE